MTSLSKVDVIILNYKNWKDTVECLDSLYEAVGVTYRTIIVDNFSNNDSVNEICSYLERKIPEYQILSQAELDEGTFFPDKKAYFICSQDNLGYGGGNNLGIKLSQYLSAADYMFVLNNDTILDKYALSYLVEKMENNKDCYICGSKIYYYDSSYTSRVVQCYAGAKFNTWLMTSSYINDEYIKNNAECNIEDELDYISGAAMFIRKDFFLNHGLFDTNFFLYFEEMDLASRLGKNEFLGYCSKSVIYHKEGASIGSSSNVKLKTGLSDYHSFRSRLYFTKKHYLRRMPLIYMLGIVYLLHRLMHGRYENAKCIFWAIIRK